MSIESIVEDTKLPLLDQSSPSVQTDHFEQVEKQNFARRIWIESKKLWQIVGPSVFGRIAAYTIFIVSQSFAGHLGDLELAALSIALSVIVGFDFGLMLGMASALETLCGQAFGAKKYYMLGVYLQRSWIVLFMFCILTCPFCIFATPILKLIGQPSDIAELAGTMAIASIPLHFSFAFQFPLQRFLQSQLKNNIIAWANLIALVMHVFISWIAVSKFKLGLVGIALTINFSRWLIVVIMLVYTIWFGCPLTWTGFKYEAFSGLWEFVKLSASSGVMLCLENLCYRILVIMTGNLENAKIAVDALSICMNINGWEMMIPLAFFAGTGIRVANELGAGNGTAAKFATVVSTTQSIVIGIFFWLIIVFFHNQIAFIFTSSKVVLEAVHHLSILLAFTILLNSVQPVLSGVAVGSGWQAYVAYINLGCYYVLGLPLGIVLGLVLNLGVMGIWAGMVGGTGIQTVILAIITARCDWDKEAKKASMHVEKWAERIQTAE